MKRLNINDFYGEVSDDGSLYVSADFEFKPDITFQLESNGDLYFNDMPPWMNNYFYFQDGQ